MRIVFSYDVEPRRAPEFERVYGPDGEWTAFFRGAAGYLGTELHRDDGDPSRYLVVDRWASGAAYAAFLDVHREEYDRRSAEAERLYRSETLVGRFDEVPAVAGLDLWVLPGIYAACRLEARAPVPAWADANGFVAVTRTAEELSIVCPEASVPAGTRSERGWRCLRVAGTLDFGLTGVAAALASPLAAAGISILLIATYDTDYLLVREPDLEPAIAALTGAGHRVSAP